MFTEQMMQARNPKADFNIEPAIVKEIGTMERPIFVFGSNMMGAHGGGAANYAYMNEGARMHIAVGPTGNSYAIPTLDDYYDQLELVTIEAYVHQFLNYARKHPNLIFKVTPIGTGIAGFKHEDIAPMFKDYPPNCIMPAEWSNLL